MHYCVLQTIQVRRDMKFGPNTASWLDFGHGSVDVDEAMPFHTNALENTLPSMSVESRADQVNLETETYGIHDLWLDFDINGDTEPGNIIPSFLHIVRTSCLCLVVVAILCQTCSDFSGDSLSEGDLKVYIGDAE